MQHCLYNAGGFGNYTGLECRLIGPKPRICARQCLEVEPTLIQTLARLESKDSQMVVRR